MASGGARLMRYGTLKRTGFRRAFYSPPPSPPVRPLERCGSYGPAEVLAMPKERIFRSEPYRRYVAEQECFGCRVVGFSQCAHENVDKGMAMKVCDSRSFPACGPHWGLIGCHAQFDLGIDSDREHRRELGAKYVAEMQARAVRDGWRFGPEWITREARP